MIIYTGKQTDTLHLQPGKSWSVSEDGLDILSEIYSGPLTAKSAWLDNHELGSTHAEYPSMYLIANPHDDGRSFSTVQLQYIGLRSGGALPESRMTRRSSIKSASISTETPEIAHRDVTYIAPEIVWAYATDSEILSPQQNPSGIPDLSEVVLRSTITTEDGQRYPGMAPANLVVALTMYPEWRHINLESSEIKHTPFWTNQEAWAYEYPTE